MLAFFIFSGKVFSKIHLFKSRVRGLTSLTPSFFMNCAGNSSYPAAFLVDNAFMAFNVSRSVIKVKEKPLEWEFPLILSLIHLTLSCSEYWEIMSFNGLSLFSGYPMSDPML